MLTNFSNNILSENNSINICIVNKRRISKLNKDFLGHKGATDVITFDYTNDRQDETIDNESIIGEVFICSDVAFEASIKYKTSYINEIILYAVHAMLHLRGLDDHSDEDFKYMKKEEKRIMQELKRDFDFSGVFNY